MEDLGRITISIDADDASMRAIDWLIGVLSRVACRVTVLAAPEWEDPFPVLAEVRLEAARNRILSALPRARVDTALGGADAATVIRFAEGSDLLVTGSHLSRRWRSLIATDRRHSDEGSATPVVVVPRDWRPHGSTILVGVSDDHSSVPALRWAAEFAHAARFEVHLLHAWARPLPSADPVGMFVRGPSPLEDEHRAHVLAASRSIEQAQPGLRVRASLYEGEHDLGLLGASHDASLIVVGSHRAGVLAGLVTGSTALELVHHSRTPVCVVPVDHVPPDPGQVQSRTSGMSSPYSRVWARARRRASSIS